jgi:hypothetical protein
MCEGAVFTPSSSKELSLKYLRCTFEKEIIKHHSDVQDKGVRNLKVQKNACLSMNMAYAFDITILSSCQGCILFLAWIKYEYGLD